MNYSSKNEEKIDKLKSASITIVVWSIILLFIGLYSVKINFPIQAEVMLINFGDNKNGIGIDEPKSQEGSIMSTKDIATEKNPHEKNIIESKNVNPKIKEKIITGKSENKTNIHPSTEKIDSESSKKDFIPNKDVESSKQKGISAVSNLLKGRGTKAGMQGSGTDFGNEGDPLGGDGYGESIIGVDRKLIGFIPGTMGRGGIQPNHSCSKSNGTIELSYIVDKAGNVVSVERVSGISDPCALSTSIEWIKKYVRAEKSRFFSSGTYRITF